MSTDIKLQDIPHIPIESLMFTFDQADKRLKYALDSYENLTKRSYSFLAISVGFFIAITGFLIDSLPKEAFDIRHTLGAAANIYLLIIIMFLIWNIRSRQLCTYGISPEYLFKRKWMVEEDKTESRFKKLLASELIEIEKKINSVAGTNLIKGRWLNISMYALTIMPILFVGLFFLIRFQLLSF